MVLELTKSLATNQPVSYAASWGYVSLAVFENKWRLQPFGKYILTERACITCSTLIIGIGDNLEREKKKKRRLHFEDVHENFECYNLCCKEHLSCIA